MADFRLTQKTTAIILAGGRGTRIAVLAPDVPKPMVQVAGKPFLEWLIKCLTREGFTEIILSIGHMANVIMTWMETRASSSAKENLQYYHEAQPLGTGGAIADVLSMVETPYVLILNGDTLLLTDFLPTLKRMVDEKLDGIIVARSLADTERYGRLDVAGGLLKEFQEKKPGQGLINGGVYAFQTDWLKQQLTSGVFSFEIDIIPRLLRNGAKIGVEVTEAPFIDIGMPETLTAASTFVITHKEWFT